MAKDWWEPREIVYYKSQMIWLLENLSYMRESGWPSDPDEIKTQRMCTYRAPFEEISKIVIEIDTRLEACGQDGAILEAYFANDLSIYNLSRIAGMREYQIDRRIRRALNYISSGEWRRWVTHKLKNGKDVKGISYKEWISHRK